RILKKDSMLVMTTEGIFKGKILEKIQKPIIRIISRFFEPENMRYEKIITIDNNNVYDKYIIIMRKKDREI
ncbi:MAG: hypothetical protein QXG00_05595, partial [Candidatus Woesearchaeota archaeon]